MTGTESRLESRVPRPFAGEAISSTQLKCYVAIRLARVGAAGAQGAGRALNAFSAVSSSMSIMRLSRLTSFRSSSKSIQSQELRISNAYHLHDCTGFNQLGPISQRRNMTNRHNYLRAIVLALVRHASLASYPCVCGGQGGHTTHGR